MSSGGSRPVRGRGIALWLALAPLWLACHSVSPGPAVPDSERIAGLQSAFSGRRAFADVEHLAKIGSRQTGTRGAARAREYLRGQLESLGARVEERSFELTGSGAEAASLSAVTLVAVLEGESSDVLLLAAPYDTPRLADSEFAGYDPDAESGAALLLELSRALALRPQPYTLWFVFIDGDGQGGDPMAEVDSSAPLAERFPGSQALAGWLAERGELARIRLAVFFGRLAAPGLSISRDLFSHRAYREVFWRSARDLGLSDAFAPRAGFASAVAGHRAFLASRLRRVVAIVNDRGVADRPADSCRQDEREPAPLCTAANLTEVGVVALEAIDRIAQRLSRIDRFTRFPLRERAAMPAKERAGEPPPPESPQAAGGRAAKPGRPL